MGSVVYFDWEVDLIEWLQQNMGKVGETASKIFSYIGGETISLLLIIILLLVVVLLLSIVIIVVV